MPSAAPPRRARRLLPPQAFVNARALVAEFVGTAFLLAAVVGSGIMAERLCGGNVGLALLANAIATGGALIALILAFGPISGAHFNPAVTVADACAGRSRTCGRPGLRCRADRGRADRHGARKRHVRFAVVLSRRTTRARRPAMLVSEFVATFGLLAVIWGCVRARPAATPYAVAAYIVGAYWFTPSTSFANPAVTIARSLTDTFSGIRPRTRPDSSSRSCAGALAATALFAWLSPIAKATAEAVVVPHATGSPDDDNGSVRLHPQQRAQPDGRGVRQRAPRRQAARVQRGARSRHDESGRRRGDARARLRPERQPREVRRRAGDPRARIRLRRDRLRRSERRGVPIYPTRGERLHWSFEDPSSFAGSPEARLARTREVRDAIARHVDAWAYSVSTTR